MEADVMSDGNLALQRELDRLRADLSMLRNDLSHLRDDAVRSAKVGATEAKERLSERLRDASAKAKQTAEAVGRQVGEHPVMSLAAVFAVGMAAGLVLSRRS
ncbi:MAG: hypothetical protein WCK33_07650 [Phycisphaerae bacterium]|jgi:ElaB/YqjD/DUF883 family membrane-anchored ribosome-binding protein